MKWQQGHALLLGQRQGIAFLERGTTVSTAQGYGYYPSRSSGVLSEHNFIKWHDTVQWEFGSMASWMQLVA